MLKTFLRKLIANPKLSPLEALSMSVKLVEFEIQFKMMCQNLHWRSSDVTTFDFSLLDWPEFLERNPLISWPRMSES